MEARTLAEQALRSFTSTDRATSCFLFHDTHRGPYVLLAGTALRPDAELTIAGVNASLMDLVALLNAQQNVLLRAGRYAAERRDLLRHYRPAYHAATQALGIQERELAFLMATFVPLAGEDLPEHVRHVIEGTVQAIDVDPSLALSQLPNDGIPTLVHMSELSYEVDKAAPLPARQTLTRSTAERIAARWQKNRQTADQGDIANPLLVWGRRLTGEGALATEASFQYCQTLASLAATDTWAGVAESDELPLGSGVLWASGPRIVDVGFCDFDDPDSLSGPPDIVARRQRVLSTWTRSVNKRLFQHGVLNGTKFLSARCRARQTGRTSITALAALRDARKLETAADVRRMTFKSASQVRFEELPPWGPGAQTGGRASLRTAVLQFLREPFYTLTAGRGNERDTGADSRKLADRLHDLMTRHRRFVIVPPAGSDARVTADNFAYLVIGQNYISVTPEKQGLGEQLDYLRSHAYKDIAYHDCGPTSVTLARGNILFTFTSDVSIIHPNDWRYNRVLAVFDGSETSETARTGPITPLHVVWVDNASEASGDERLVLPIGDEQQTRLSVMRFWAALDKRLSVSAQRRQPQGVE
ncbi:hypothetical protein GMRT_20714 [Giardia muris]|uniref:Uncharacterized protein n=1 Tax=Giardia muris TaxID=5742 RepID=A0A4Z1TBK6_GIAMU|nr:hypothetical protein GMRT_10329 [Giardia muris]TNJ29909.1 hypothetical protein GMRT_20714 [Giardia muris]|eukprot:TNJ29904.1 hypothetical protein GMRT_10329 [Giardia muris]